MSDQNNRGQRQPVDDEEVEKETTASSSTGSTPDGRGTTAKRESVPPETASAGSTRAEQANPLPDSGASGGAETDRRNHVIIGPAKSGKSTLLTSFERACQLPVDDDMDLAFAPDEETSMLIQGVYKRIAGKEIGLAATEGVHDYPFHISVTAESRGFWRVPVKEDLEIVMSDGAGGYLLPLEEDPHSEAFRREMIARVGRASTLVLCVNIVDLNLTLLKTELSRLLSKTRRAREVEIPLTLKERLRVGIAGRINSWKIRIGNSLGPGSCSVPTRPGRVAARNGNGTHRRTRACLAADRFLLLLTQVDKLCDLFPDEVLPVNVAKMIDPVEQAKYLLGPPLLKEVYDSVRPGGKVAVGICSALGFHPETGTPFADVNGRPLSWPGEPGEELLRNWTPFGVRDAIYFIATGNCRGTIKEVTKAGLLMANRANELRLKSSR